MRQASHNSAFPTAARQFHRRQPDQQASWRRLRSRSLSALDRRPSSVPSPNSVHESAIAQIQRFLNALQDSEVRTSPAVPAIVADLEKSGSKRKRMAQDEPAAPSNWQRPPDRKSTRLNSSHRYLLSSPTRRFPELVLPFQPLLRILRNLARSGRGWRKTSQPLPRIGNVLPVRVLRFRRNLSLGDSSC